MTNFPIYLPEIAESLSLLEFCAFGDGIDNTLFCGNSSSCLSFLVMIIFAYATVCSIYEFLV